MPAVDGVAFYHIRNFMIFFKSVVSPAKLPFKKGVSAGIASGNVQALFETNWKIGSGA
jgi:hypothetical protein